MKKFLIIFFACLLVGVAAFAQTKTVTGKVIGGDDKQGIPGASVLIKETKKGVAADVDGKYSIQVAKGQTLMFSAIGYAERSIVVGDDNVINVTLSQDISVLSEAVVVGFGTQKKENLTGAVASVNVEKTLQNRPIADVGRGLQGTVAGLTIRQFSGEVGSEPIIRIRGYSNSPNGQKDSPLLLLDNVEIPSIQLVNPSDIESITVLKDAASASIYGSKAAAGVILMTTKKGAKTESVTVNFSSDFGWQNPAKKIEMAGVDYMDYALLVQERINPGVKVTAGGFWKFSRESWERAKAWQEKYGKTGLVKPNDPVLYNRDWYMEGTTPMAVRIYDPAAIMVKEWAPSTHNSLSVNGLSGKTGYSIGVGYIREQGMLKPAKVDDFTRYNVSVNVQTEVNKWLTVRGGAIFSDRDKRYPGADTYGADPWFYVYRWSTVFPIGVEENGIPVRGAYNETANAITANQRYMYNSFNIGATLNFMKDWDLRMDYNHYQENRSFNRAIPNFHGVDIWNGNAAGGGAPRPWIENGNPVYVNEDGIRVEEGGVPAYKFYEMIYNFPGGTNPVPYITKTRREIFDNTFNAYSNYKLLLGSEQQHRFDLMIGASVHTNDWNELTGKKTDLADFDNPQFNFAYPDEKGVSTSHTAGWGSEIGFFGRLKYALYDKYLFEFNMRRDGASVFPKHLKWNLYPSFSAGWVISREKFMEKLAPVLSLAKLRASWGSLGDAYVTNSIYAPTMPYAAGSWLVNGSRTHTFSPAGAVNGDITWQSFETLDIGLDLRFFNNKLGVTFEWFQKYTRDMIIGGDTRPATFGTSVPLGNYGELRTRGFELSLDFNHRFANGIGIYVNATLADATAVCTKGADYLTPWENRGIGANWNTGARYGDIWGYVTDRLYQKEDFVYEEDGKTIKKTTRVTNNGTIYVTNLQSGNNPHYQCRFEAGTFFFGPGDVKYIDLDGDGYLTPGAGTFGDHGDRMVIGNSTPRYEYGCTLGVDWKGFDLKVFIQGIGKREMIGAGGLVIPGYNTSEGAMSQALASNFWKEDRTDAFYPRAWNLGGTIDSPTVNNFNNLVQTRYLLNMAYTRIKNITFGYTLPAQLSKKISLNKARFYVSLENFFTFDNLHGLPIDVEEVAGYSMFNNTGYNGSRTGSGTPTYKTVSLGLNLTF